MEVYHNFTPQPASPGEGNPVPVESETVCSLDLSWTFWKNRQIAQSKLDKCVNECSPLAQTVSYFRRGHNLALSFAMLYFKMYLGEGM